MKRLSLSIFLIILASSVLLISDLNQRQKKRSRIPNIAILQYSSHTFLDDGVKGIMDGLKEKGFEDGSNINIRHFNSEGDLPTTNTIAKEITSGKYDYALTVSTPALQAVANANKQGKVIQIFGVVTDPFIAGVGLDKKKPYDHPRHLVGYGSFLPVVKLIEIAKELDAITGSTELNDAGDRKFANFDFWGVREENGVFIWEKVGFFDAANNQITEFE